MKKQTLMTEGNIWKQIILFSIPLILGNLMQQLYNTADMIIVGQFVGSNALAAVGSSGSLIGLLIGFCTGTSAGAGVVIAQGYGAKKERDVERAVHTTMALALILGAVVMVIGILFSPQILQWMGTPKAVLQESILYLRIYFCGMIPGIVYNMSAGILNAVGNSGRSLVYLAIASVTNIVLDLVFVGWLDLGVAGVGIATGLSQVISCICIVGYMMKTNDMYKVHLRKIYCHPDMAKKIIAIGLPTGIQNMVLSLSNVLIQSGVNGFGEKAMAGFAAYMKIDGFNILPLMSFSMAATTFTGQNVGAKRIDRVKKGMWVTLILGVGYTILSGAFLLTFAEPIIGIFTNDSIVIQYGKLAAKFFCPFYFLLAVMHEQAGTIRGTGKTIPPMAVILFALCVVRVFWMQAVAPHVTMIAGIYVIYPISWTIGAVLMSLYSWKGKWLPQSM